MTRVGSCAMILATLGGLATPGAATAQRTAVFAGGCFWGIEAVFEHVKGVKEAVSGYAGGTMKNPSYALVSTGRTGYAESVSVTYDPSEVTYDQLLEVFFAEHDPTELNRQGPDTGTQYRTAIFFATPEEADAAQRTIARMTAEKRFERPIVTEVTALSKFWPAEDYHQNYLEHHRFQPYIFINDLPKLSDLKKRFPALWRE